MDFQQLECLIEVCKYNSFTRAANAIYLSQSTISKNIAALEQELGISLIERSRHSVTPTQAGIYMAREADRIVSEMTRIAERAQQIASGKKGYLKIGICDELDLNGLIPGFINGFSRKYPGIEITMSVQGYKELATMIINDSLDVGFGPCAYAVGQNQTELKSLIINRATPRLYFSCDHRYATKRDLKPSDFKDDSYVIMRNRFGRTLANLEANGLEFKGLIYVDSLQAMKLYVESNQGVCILGESYVIANSDKVDSIQVDGMAPVGTDMFYKDSASNEATILFRREMEQYLEERNNSI